MNWHRLQTCRNCKYFPLNMGYMPYVTSCGLDIGKNNGKSVKPNTRACEQFTAIEGKSKWEQFLKLLRSIRYKI